MGTKTKAIVPIFIAGEFIGVVGFDNTRQRRAIDTAELAALETAAGVIGAALHRERLVDDVRREREHAAEERVAELAKANQVIRGNLERLASEPDLGSFMGHMLMEAARQFDAASGSVIVRKDTLQEWRIVAHVRDGQVGHAALSRRASHSLTLPSPTPSPTQQEPVYFNVGANPDEDIWPGALAFHRSREGYVGVVIYPLVFGARSVGFFILSFRRNAEDVQRSELLVALAQQATLAVQLTRLAYSAKEAAVLVERTRIGQEIHDGLAQSFTGILMQLGAAEEFRSCKKRDSELAHSAVADPRPGARRTVRGAPLGHGVAARQTRRAGLEDRAAPAGGRAPPCPAASPARLMAVASPPACARARTRAAAHCPGSGQQRRAPCAATHSYASAMADEAQYWSSRSPTMALAWREQPELSRERRLRADEHARSAPARSAASGDYPASRGGHARQRTHGQAAA